MSRRPRNRSRELEMEAEADHERTTCRLERREALQRSADIVLVLQLDIMEAIFIHVTMWKILLRPRIFQWPDSQTIPDWIRCVQQEKEQTKVTFSNALAAVCQRAVNHPDAAQPTQGFGLARPHATATIQPIGRSGIPLVAKPTRQFKLPAEVTALNEPSEKEADYEGGALPVTDIKRLMNYIHDNYEAIKKGRDTTGHSISAGEAAAVLIQYKDMCERKGEGSRRFRVFEDMYWVIFGHSYRNIPRGGESVRIHNDDPFPADNDVGDKGDVDGCGGEGGSGMEVEDQTHGE